MFGHPEENFGIVGDSPLTPLPTRLVSCTSESSPQATRNASALSTQVPADRDDLAAVISPSSFKPVPCSRVASVTTADSFQSADLLLKLSAKPPSDLASQIIYEPQDTRKASFADTNLQQLSLHACSNTAAAAAGMDDVEQLSNDDGQHITALKSVTAEDSIEGAGPMHAAPANVTSGFESGGVLSTNTIESYSKVTLSQIGVFSEVTSPSSVTRISWRSFTNKATSQPLEKMEYGNANSWNTTATSSFFHQVRTNEEESELFKAEGKVSTHAHEKIADARSTEKSEEEVSFCKKIATKYNEALFENEIIADNPTEHQSQKEEGLFKNFATTYSKASFENEISLNNPTEQQVEEEEGLNKKITAKYNEVLSVTCQEPIEEACNTSVARASADVIHGIESNGTGAFSSLISMNLDHVTSFVSSSNYLMPSFVANPLPVSVVDTSMDVSNFSTSPSFWPDSTPLPSLAKPCSNFSNKCIKLEESVTATSLKQATTKLGGISRNLAWTAAERRTLLRAYRFYGDTDWVAISASVSGRSKTECMAELKDLWVVKSFVDHRPASKEKGYWELKTRWVGWSAADDTWEPIAEKSLEVSDLADQYIKCHPEVDAGKASKRKRPETKCDNLSNKKALHDTKHVGAKKRQTIKIEEYEESTETSSIVSDHDEKRQYWTNEELKILVSSCGDDDEKPDWRQISKAVCEVGGGRTIGACQRRFYIMSDEEKVRSWYEHGEESNEEMLGVRRQGTIVFPWTDKELEVLVSLTDDKKEHKWHDICEAVGRVGMNRSINSCQLKLFRMSESEKVRIRRRSEKALHGTAQIGKKKIFQMKKDKKSSETSSIGSNQAKTWARWTEKERKVLVSSHDDHGDEQPNWWLISKAVGEMGDGRTIKACKHQLYKMSEEENVRLRYEESKESNMMSSSVRKKMRTIKKEKDEESTEMSSIVSDQAKEGKTWYRRLFGLFSS